MPGRGLCIFWGAVGPTWDSGRGHRPRRAVHAGVSTGLQCTGALRGTNPTATLHDSGSQPSRVVNQSSDLSSTYPSLETCGFVVGGGGEGEWEFTYIDVELLRSPGPGGGFFLQNLLPVMPTRSKQRAGCAPGRSHTPRTQAYIGRAVDGACWAKVAHWAGP
jgi:hypothetical protein